MRIVFMGTPGFAVPTLKGLVAHGHDVIAAYCPPPRPAGRKKKLTPCAVQIAAEGLGIPVRCPDRFSESERCQFEDLGADVAVVVAYGVILPDAILGAPRHGCINMHPSLLPRWRGAAPIQRAITEGDDVTGVSIMRIGRGIDSGPVYCQTEIPIGRADTADTLGGRLSQLGADLICEKLPSLAMLTPVEQDETQATYASKISNSETRIDWTRPAEAVDCMIRGLSSSPGAWTSVVSERIRILRSELAPLTGDTASARPGTVLDDQLTVQCGTGAVRLLVLQRSGKKPLPAGEFCRGFAIPPGSRL